MKPPKRTAPKQNELEVTVFGPGYGECIVLHVGSGKWLIVDSCLDDHEEPVAISYLRSLGVAVEEEVYSVSASHWHDDHIKGLAQVVMECRNARFALSSALTDDEFVAFLMVHEERQAKIDRGGAELLKCLRHARSNRRRIKPLSEDTIIIDFDEGCLSHGKRVELRALSPSGIQFDEFLRRISQFYETRIGKPRTRIVAPNRNDLSVAMLLTVGEQAVLLGADLENTRDTNKGWKAVVNNRAGRRPLGHVHKIPHHGSKDAHNADVWNTMLASKTWAVVTPWIKGGKYLPTTADRQRLKSLAHKVYLTSDKPLNIKKKYPRDVVKHVLASGIRFSSAIYAGGHVTLRWAPPEPTPMETLENGAVAI